MQEKEFNLLREPWVKVITPSLEQKDVSLTDALVHAHEYADLSGEMPTQDAAMLRVLLAVAVTIFYRYDANGDEEELSEENNFDEHDVLERWKDYWEMGKFPEQAIEDYLEAYAERFWLFHPETPFWQVANLQYGTNYDIECLFGNIKESMNKATRHHFSMTDGDEMYRLRYGEAARWLIHLNAYAINLKTDKNAPGTTLPVGTGRLGQLGFVMVNGKNLFQILMMNLCAFNCDGALWEAPKPAWEQEVCRDQSRKVGTPDNLPERYTLQSRRIMLKRDSNGNLTGFRALGGDFYPVENDSGEPMTIWKEKKKDSKTGEELPLRPQVHNPAVHAWREFPALLNAKSSGNGDAIPGVVQWVNTLCCAKIIPADALITFRMIGMVYGDQMKYNYGDCVNDTLTLSAKLLNDLNSTDKVWITRISDQVEKCQAVAGNALNHFASKMCRLLYGSSAAKSGIKAHLIRQYYFSIDAPFREWLAGIDPAQSKSEEKISEWEKQSRRFARKTVEDYVSTLGTDIYLCREDDSRGSKKELLSIPKIVNDCWAELNKIYVQTETVQ